MNIKIFNSYWLYIAVFIITAVVMTTYEYIKEIIFQGMLTPWQSHTITIIITALIATFTASLIKSWVLTVSLKQKEVEAKEQSLASFQLILTAVNHIVNNVLNQLQLIRVDIENNGELQEENLKLLEESIAQADIQMKLLNKIQNPGDPESYKGIYPE